MNNPSSVTVIGLGYVGLPLALAFAAELPTTGLDIDGSRVEELLAGVDRNREVPEGVIKSSAVSFTTENSCVANAEFIVVTVSTPVTEDYKPDLSLLESASEMIGTRLRDRSSDLPSPIIVFESTTYPGCTEDFCGPIIERESGLKSGEGFFLGYSPERTNFGDGEHTLETVIKVVSGQTPEVTQVVSEMYGRIAKAGTHLAVDIRTAEASKVIENVQRDLNIALFNELAIIFDRMGIRSSDVFDAAATKWNFHRYQPGLVGGHCNPVDPYYLTYSAAKLGYDAEVILGGRTVNESMPGYIAAKTEQLAIESGIEPGRSSVLVLGATFKKDVVDTRNSKSITLANRLTSVFRTVHVYDPHVESTDSDQELFSAVDDPFSSDTIYDVVILAVAHADFAELETRFGELLSENGVIVNATGSASDIDTRESPAVYWSL